jgi:glycosyltransferase involved in cell wall biosynthesis
MDIHVPQMLLPSVYKAADCVVIPSRGEGWLVSYCWILIIEGWGRPHAEGMSMAKPVIATAWSGPTEFMTQKNSYPLNAFAQLVPIKEGTRRKALHNGMQDLLRVINGPNLMENICAS